jgi:hypothetical protein
VPLKSPWTGKIPTQNADRRPDCVDDLATIAAVQLAAKSVILGASAVQRSLTFFWVYLENPIAPQESCAPNAQHRRGQGCAARAKRRLARNGPKNLGAPYRQCEPARTINGFSCCIRLNAFSGFVEKT